MPRSQGLPLSPEPSYPWNGVHKASPKASSPTVTGISYPRTPVDRTMTSEPLSAPQGSSEGSVEPVTPRDYESLDNLWDNLRHQKELKMSKQPPKVKSLEGADLPVLTLPAKPTIKKRKSHCTFRDAMDGRTVTATFDLPGIKKQDVHISFQRNRLVVNWETVTVTETEEDGRLLRERKENTYNRTIPLPEGTRFEEVRAAMDGRHLILTYPSMRSVRVDNRPRSPSIAQ